MSSDPDGSVRALLESAVPRETVPAPLAAEIRAIGRRRQRRTQALSAAVAVAAVTAVAIVGVQVLKAPVNSNPTPVSSGSTTSSPSSSPSITGVEPSSLVGTRWVTPTESTSNDYVWPGQKGAGAFSTVTLGTGHRFTLDYWTKNGTVHVAGSWQITGGPGPLTGSSKGDIRLTLDPPTGPEGDGATFVRNRVGFAKQYSNTEWDQPTQPYLTGLHMVVIQDTWPPALELFQVKAGATVPGT
jgi:hypothetical protein